MQFYQESEITNVADKQESVQDQSSAVGQFQNSESLSMKIDTKIQKEKLSHVVFRRFPHTDAASIS